MDPGRSSYEQERSRMPVIFAAGAGIVLLGVAALLLTSRMTQRHGPANAAKLPFGSAEQTYAQRIHFLNPQMARANNFLNQEFTYVAGTVSNDGTRTIRAMEITLEFRDPMNEVVLREARQIVGPDTKPIEGGQRSDFQITLEHVPATWSQQYPNLRVTGLILE
jgi:hypothetical protein